MFSLNKSRHCAYIIYRVKTRLKKHIIKQNEITYQKKNLFHQLSDFLAITVRSFLLLLKSQTLRILSFWKAASFSSSRTASSFRRTPASPTRRPSLRVTMTRPPGARAEHTGRTSSRTESRTSRLASHVNSLNKVNNG